MEVSLSSPLAPRADITGPVCPVAHRADSVALFRKGFPNVSETLRPTQAYYVQTQSPSPAVCPRLRLLAVPARWSHRRPGRQAPCLKYHDVAQRRCSRCNPHNLLATPLRRCAEAGHTRPFESPETMIPGYRAVRGQDELCLMRPALTGAAAWEDPRRLLHDPAELTKSRTLPAVRENRDLQKEIVVTTWADLLQRKRSDILLPTPTFSGPCLPTAVGAP
jgi:hypothetical protein